MQVKVEGKSNIVAEVICDSISEQGKRITTFCLEYPRIVHSELMTHRMLSRNAASSRAIPFKAMVENLNGKPVRFGAANAGMQDKGEDFRAEDASEAWGFAKDSAKSWAKQFYDAGYHKQVYNRLLEPFQMIKVIVTTTEWNNFFWLRDDEAADPTIRELARCMKQAMEQSTPQVLKAGEWHLPFMDFEDGVYYSPNDHTNTMYSLDDAIKMSAARCAAVSYRKEDYGLEKCLEVYKRLVGSEKKHSSAMEHQATPMDITNCTDGSYDSAMWPEGVTHQDREGNLWSGNFQSWIQYRQLIPHHVKQS